MASPSSRTRSRRVPTGDTSPTPQLIEQAAQTGQPVYLVTDQAAHAHLCSWGCVAVLVLPTMEQIDAGTLSGSHLVILREPTPEQQRWAERLATHLVEAQHIVKILQLSSSCTVAEWLQNEGSPSRLDQYETLTSRFAPSKDRQVKAADWMVSYVLENARLLTTAIGEPFIRYSVGTTVRTAKLGKREVSDYLLSAYYDAFGKTPSEDAIRTSRSVLGMHARLHGEQTKAFSRVGQAEGRIYLDLGNADWTVVEIDRASGWRVMAEPPVVLTRAPDTKPLPLPAARNATSDVLARAGFDTLRKYVHLASEEEFYLLWGFLVFCLNPTGPFPHIAFVGGQATGKSITMELIRSTVDPVASVQSRAVPTSLRELAISTRGTYLMVYDNLSNLSPLMSDAFCRLTTGFGHAERRLMTDDEEDLYFAIRPVLSNGIVGVVQREDLGSRTFTLRFIKPDPAIEEDELRALFEKDHPVILTGLIECAWMAYVTGGRRTQSNLTRLLAFERWAAEAAHLVGGEQGMETLRRALTFNQRDSLLEAADSDALVQLLRQLLETQGTWRGTMTELSAALAGMLRDPLRPPPDVPLMARALSAKIARKQPVLEAIGISVTDEGLQGPSHHRRRLYSLSLSS